MARKSARKTVLPNPPVGRHKNLLSNPHILDWYRELCLRSRLSADTYLRQLGLLAERISLSPEDIVTTAKRNPEKLRRLLVKYAAEQKDEGYLDSYIMKSLNGVKAWLEHHHANFRDYPKLKPIKGASLMKERVPTQEELGRVLDRLSLRARVAALLMAHSGLRPGVLGGYMGEDGLRLSALPDLQLTPSPSFKQVPFTIHVPADLSKTRVFYTTFGTEQLAQTLLAYLGERMDRGERLTTVSPVIAAGFARGIAKKSREEAKLSKGFMTTKVVVEEIREGLRSVVPTGVTWRPYVLRAYCSTRLLMAEGQGKISRDLREAILGHDGGVAARYNVGKPWGEELLKEARAAYGRCEPFLATHTTAPKEDVPRQVAIAMLQLAGFGEEEIEKMDLNDLAAIRDQVRERLGASDGPRQEVVSIGEVPQRLAAGWQFVAALGTTQAIVTSPSSPRTSPTPAASASPLRPAASPVPLAGQSAVGGSRVGAPQSSSAVAGPSLSLPLVPRASGRPGEELSVGAHRMEPHRGSPEEDSPVQS